MCFESRYYAQINEPVEKTMNQSKFSSVQCLMMRYALMTATPSRTNICEDRQGCVEYEYLQSI